MVQSSIHRVLYLEAGQKIRGDQKHSYWWEAVGLLQFSGGEYACSSSLVSAWVQLRLGQSVGAGSRVGHTQPSLASASASSSFTSLELVEKNWVRLRYSEIHAFYRYSLAFCPQAHFLFFSAQQDCISQPTLQLGMATGFWEIECEWEGKPPKV